MLSSPWVIDTVLHRSLEHPNGAHDTISLVIKGMGCSACALAVKRALEHVPGISDCVVQESGIAICLGHSSQKIAASNAIYNVGFMLDDDKRL